MGIAYWPQKRVPRRAKYAKTKEKRGFDPLNNYPSILFRDLGCVKTSSRFFPAGSEILSKFEQANLRSK